MSTVKREGVVQMYTPASSVVASAAIEELWAIASVMRYRFHCCGTELTFMDE